MKSQYLSRIRTDHYAISRENSAHQGERLGWSKTGVKNLRWQMIAILEIHKQAYLSNFWTDLHQIWFADRSLPCKCRWGPKLHFLEFLMFGHISVANEDIFIKFGTTAGQFGRKQIQFNLIWQNFDSIHYCCITWIEAIYELWSAMSNVLAKLLTVISLALAVNAQ